MKKKPSSAKRSIEQQTFSPFISSKRLETVQNILRSDNNKDGAILSILGIDSRYNEGCRELANYLLFGFYDLRMAQFEMSGIPEEELDDVIILVRSTSVAVYCSGILYNYLLPYIAHWRNLEIFCLPLEELDSTSEEEKEEFKIRSFVSMLHGSTNIGIPYWSSRGLGVPSQLQLPPEFDKFAIEKWPLIQSFALEGVGSGSFFTMQFDVTDVRGRLLPIYDECDPADLEQTLIKSLPLFERHWKEAVGIVSKSRGDEASSALMDVTESQVAEVELISDVFKRKEVFTIAIALAPVAKRCGHLEWEGNYYNHGRLSAKYRRDKERNEEVDSSSTKPFVRFGSRSSDAVAAASKGPSADDDALHLVMHLIAPRRPISCSRTYFISPRTQSQERDSDLLKGSYLACVEACQAGIQEYCSTLSVSKAQSAADVILAKALPPSSCFKSKLEGFGNSGKTVQLIEGKYSFSIKTFTVSIDNIKSVTGNTVLGSVLFADTFIESILQTVDAGSKETNHLENHILLTKGIQTFIEWQASKRDIDVGSTSIAAMKNVSICSSSPLFDCSSTCDVEFFQDGTAVVSPSNYPSFSIQALMLNSFGYYDTGLPNAATLLHFDVKSAQNLPIVFRGSLALAFPPQTTSGKMFTSKVLPRLEELAKSDSNKFTQLGHLSDDLTAPYIAIQDQYMWLAGLSHRGVPRSTKLTASTATLQPELTGFMNHFGVGFVLSNKPIPSSDVAALLESDRSMENGDAPFVSKSLDSKVCITVVAGLPGCHGDQLAASLVALHKERVRWVVVRAQSKDGDACVLDEDHLQKQLSDSVSKRLALRRGAAATKKLRIIVEVTGFFDLANVVSCITNHKDSTTRGSMVIGSVTACIDPLACLIEHNRLLPKVLEQCTCGIVNCVAFTGVHEDLKDKNLASMQLMVRDVNPNAAFLLAADGQTSRTGDFDLILSEEAFESEANRSLRHLATPDLWRGSFIPGSSPLKMQDIILRFSQPLLKGTLSAKLRALQHAMAAFPYTGNIYMVKGVLAFTDSPDQEWDLCFVSRTCQLTIAPRPQPLVKAPAPPPSRSAPVSRPYHLRFYGVGICEESLQAWLRKCGRQKPSKKCRKSRANLSSSERKRIQSARQNDALPEGIFYNGAQYCSLIDNSRSNEHPNIEQFIEEYLKKENEEIEAYNAKIDAQNIKDLFD